MDSPDKLVQEIEKLTVQNLQSDERFSESYILSRYNSGFGPTRIKYDLLTNAKKSWDFAAGGNIG